jgi:hypothetical protein
MLLSFLPFSVPAIGLLKVTTLVIVSTAVAQQLYHAFTNYPGLYVESSAELWANVPTRAVATTSSVAPLPQLETTDMFGACLMVKDDNELLYEWLAYHYTILPLRYIVVGSDINSTQDPTAILERWREKTDLRFRVLQASEFSNRYDEGPTFEKDETSRHHHALVSRQKGFISACSELLQKQGIRWTAYIDSDEFVVPNRLSEHDEGLVVDGSKHNSIRKESYQIRSSLEAVGSPNTTVVDVLLELQKHGIVGSCYTTPRLLVGALENRTCPAAKEVSDLARRRFQYRSMNTLRFLQHAKKGDFQYSKFGKVFMDLGRIPEDTVLNVKPRNIHRPYRDHCGPGVVHFPDTFFYLNHYIGSWERYSSRPDGRRNRNEWEQRAHLDDGTAPCESAIHGWFSRFISSVGEEQARYLMGVTP